jgi:hypothetical protein
MKRILSTLPRNVLISAIVLLVSALLFGAAVHFLGGARDGAIAENARLATEIQTADTGIIRAKDDYQYVVDHQAEYEKLIKSDKLLPHTRRAAVVELQDVAAQRGLTTLNYSFSAAGANSLQAVAAQPKAGTYRVSVETVELKVGAPYDGAIYGFIADVTEAFPGSAVVDSISLARAQDLTDTALAAISAGQEAQLVTGEIRLSWRTAQADEKPAAAGAK